MLLIAILLPSVANIAKAGIKGGDGMALAVIREGGDGFESDVGRLGGTSPST